MSHWTKKQRMEAVLNGELADRPPISAWRHYIDHEHDAQDLAKIMIEHQKKYDWDYMKINPRAVYYHEAWGNEYDFTKYNDIIPTCVKRAVNEKKDLEKIQELSGVDGVFAEQLEAIRLIKGEMKDELPIFMTIFTPIAVLLNLCGMRSLGRYREAPREESAIIKLIYEDKNLVHKSIAAIARTLAKYAAAAVKSGADGVFYAALGMARSGYFTKEEWEEFVKPYDLIILEELKNAITIVHTCGIYSNPEWFVDYPINIIHWAESATGNPTLKDSTSWIGNKIAMGGVDERLFGTGAEEEIAKRTKNTVKTLADRPFILAPDCSLSIKTLDYEMRAFRNAVEE
jgi:uroporphyrinogen decarboxylase